MLRRFPTLAYINSVHLPPQRLFRTMPRPLLHFRPRRTRIIRTHLRDRASHQLSLADQESRVDCADCRDEMRFQNRHRQLHGMPPQLAIFCVADRHTGPSRARPHHCRAFGRSLTQVPRTTSWKNNAEIVHTADGNGRHCGPHLPPCASAVVQLLRGVRVCKQRAKQM